MNGAEKLLQTLIQQGVEVCFTNPGTSEMHMVAAIGKTDGMRSVLSLFEGVCTGAADGYARMAGKPACTLLHLGPGLSNGSANLHNAKKGNVPVLNLIGDHATYHKQFDAPLTSDIIGLSQPVSHWTKTVATADELPTDAAEAVAVANSGAGKIATLIVPANCAWDECVKSAAVAEIVLPQVVADDQVSTAASLLNNGKSTVLLLNNLALTEEALQIADKISQASGAKLFCDTFTARLPRGEGRVAVERLGYFAEQAETQLAGVEQFILIGTKSPVAFFAYPGKASEFYSADSIRHTLAGVDDNAEDALHRLSVALDCDSTAPRFSPLKKAGLGDGDLSPRSIGMTFAELMPIDAIVVDEGATSGGGCYMASQTAEPHDWLSLTGGSIGYGLPVAVGAAIACPDRKVLCIHGDGGAMYTIQSLWTMARENLDICVVIFANRKYQILQVELARVGAQSMTKKTLDMLDISNPDLDFVKIAEGMGVAASRATTIEEFNEQYELAMSESGPRLIEAVLP
ncbi:MAG: acetolactate synthase-1/2/3 large subunit [Candidatus Azotimanducaceae bacterium]|jgi:acetolactate synthase-1/2/3 large subunit